MARQFLIVECEDGEEPPVITSKMLRTLRMLAVFETREEQPAPDGAEQEDPKA